MLCRLSDPRLAYLAERYATGDYGEELCCGDGGGVVCAECESEIRPFEEYYDVNGVFFCMRCDAAAERRILDLVREDYIFEAR